MQNIDKFLIQQSSDQTGGQNTITSIANINQAEDRGIIPRAISDLFQKIRNENIAVSVYCSFIQIYNEKLFDLLRDPK